MTHLNNFLPLNSSNYKTMKRQNAANISIFATFILVLLSFSFGFHNYAETKKAIISDLNQALQYTIMQNSDQWLSRDSLQTYSKLSALWGSPLAIESQNKDLSYALRFDKLKKEAGIIMQITNKNEKKSVPTQAFSDKKQFDNYLTSDTIMWVAANISSPDPVYKDIGLSFQGYVSCSFCTILSLTHKTLPSIFLALALISGMISIYLRRYNHLMQVVCTEKSIVYGNLAFSQETSSFYKDSMEKLKLTPMQHSVMEMFFQSPTHILNRTDICEALWPGKVNADETLNTLMRRLRPLIEDNSNLKITTDRGKAYILELKDTDFAD